MKSGSKRLETAILGAERMNKTYRRDNCASGDPLKSGLDTVQNAFVYTALSQCVNHIPFKINLFKVAGGCHHWSWQLNSQFLRSCMSVLSWIHLDFRLNGTRTLHFLWTIWCHRPSVNYHDLNPSCPSDIQHGATLLTKKMLSPNNNGNINNQLVVSVWGNFSRWFASLVCQTTRDMILLICCRAPSANQE